MQIIFGGFNVFFAHLTRCRVREPHKRLGCIGAPVNQLGSSLPGAGKVQLVLNGLKKQIGIPHRRLIIRGQSKNLAHPQIHPLLTGADIADTHQQFIKIIRRRQCADRRIFQALVINGEAFLQILAQGARGPLAKLRTTTGAHAVADGDNHRQCVNLCLIIFAVSGSCQL